MRGVGEGEGGVEEGGAREGVERFGEGGLGREEGERGWRGEGEKGVWEGQ